MLVSYQNLATILPKINASEFTAFDVETNGRFPYQGDRLFSLAVATESHDFYFNFNEIDEGHLEKDVLKLLNPQGTIFMHNAKFDLEMLKLDGLDLSEKRVWCTMAMGRVERNTHLNLGLDSLGKYVGMRKDKGLEEYCTKNGLFEWEQSPGKKKRSKRCFYHLVPLEVIQPYAEKDARICYKLGIHQMMEIFAQDQTTYPGHPKIQNIVDNEIELTPVLLKMEEKGVLIDADYVKEARDYEKKNIKLAEEKFKFYTGSDFLDSNKELKIIFDKLDLPYGRTDKGNPSFCSDALKANPSEIGNIILEQREAYKKYGTYYQNFLGLMDHNHVIHPNFSQGGAATGRFSCREPNLQNIPKRGEDDKKYPVRKSFIPRAGRSFFMLDYDQMEYKLLVDLANERVLIDAIRDGYDVHEGTARTLRRERREAKTLNFAMVYGVGIDELARMLGCSPMAARSIKNDYFRKLPRIAKLIQDLINKASRIKSITNIMGRRYYFTRETSYKAPNYYIQGGCADIIKKAMIQIDSLLEGTNSHMLLQIHDELLFEIPPEERHLLPKIKNIMETVYLPRSIPLTVGVDYSDISWHEKRPWEGHDA